MVSELQGKRRNGVGGAGWGQAMAPVTRRPRGRATWPGLGQREGKDHLGNAKASNEVTYVGVRHEALYTIQRTGGASFNECVLHALGCVHKTSPHFTEDHTEALKGRVT